MTVRLDHTIETLKRLAQLDAALSGDGILVSEFAERYGLSTKTVRRDLETLRGLGAEIPKGKQDGLAKLFRYRDRRQRVFSEWVARG